MRSAAQRRQHPFYTDGVEVSNRRPKMKIIAEDDDDRV